MMDTLGKMYSLEFTKKPEPLSPTLIAFGWLNPQGF